MSKLTEKQQEIYKKIKDSGVEFIDDEELKALDKIDFKTILWDIIFRINRYAAGLPMTSGAYMESVDHLGMNLYFYQDKDFFEEMNELNKAYGDAYYSIDPGKRKNMDESVRLQYTKNKYKLLIKLMGRKGLLGAVAYSPKS